MTIRLDTMQRIDFWVGIPLCWVCSLLVKLWNHLFHPALPSPKNVLFIELSEMGSAFLAYPSMQTLSREFPGANLHFLIFHRNRESVSLLRIVPESQIITIDDSSLVRFALTTVVALTRLWRARIDTSIDLELFSRCTALLTLLSGAGNRVGFFKFVDEGLYRGSFLTHPVHYNNLQHMSENFLALVLALKEDPTDLPLTRRDVRPYRLPLPQLAIEQRHHEQLSEILAQRGFKSGSHRLILFNPDPGLLTLRGWSLSSYLLLGQKLLELDPAFRIGVVGLPRSQHYAKDLQSQLGSDRILDLTGVTSSMFELGVLMNHAELMIGTDSGPAHLASLTKISNVVLFGPESPLRYAPLGERSITLFAGLACSPCYSAANHRRSVCKENRCMSEISPQQVFEASKQLLRA